jgi:hypothetical protein
MEFPSKDAFEEWLLGKPPREIVARHWNAKCCPLANCFGLWIQPNLGGGLFGEMPPEGVGMPAATFTLPKWAKQFADKVDSSRRDDNSGITARRCLTLLKAIDANIS